MVKRVKINKKIMIKKEKKDFIPTTKKDFSPIFEKLPPQNIEAEEALLGSLMIDKDAVIKIADQIETQDFYKDIHQMIFQSMLDVWESREPIDILSVSNRLEEKGQLDSIGGRSYLASLANTIPSSSHISSYAQIVKKKSTLRKLIKSSTEIIQMAYQEEDDTIELLDKSEQKIFSISQKYVTQKFVPLKDTLAQAFERLDELHKGDKNIRGVPTGFNDLDDVLAGLQPGELIILAARPSIGKSALALDIARNAAVYHKKSVGIFSLEMSKEHISDRMICAQANVGVWKLRTGRLSRKDDDGDFERLGQAMGILADAPIFIDDTAMATPIEIRTKARRLQAEHGLDLLILDYLQLMDGGIDSREGRVQEVSHISRSLKAVARELNIPILALSQLSRAPEARTPAIPRLSDLRESGGLEQDADVVMFIYRKSMDRGIKNCPEHEKNIAEIYIGKHRHGPAGVMVPLYFDNDTVSFRNLEKKMGDLDESSSEDETAELPF